MDYQNLVFEGGGVKGIAYAGAIDVLEQKGILQNAKRVAGTSAGAITATLVALNFSAAEITKAINDLDFKSFEDKLNPLRILKTYGLYKGDAFLQWMKSYVVKKTQNENSTFADLNAAGGFKDLKIFATDLYIKGIQEFSFEKTPNTIVAEAARASMSIPLFFKAWKFSNSQPNDHIYVDGGVLFNYPMEIFPIIHNTLGFYLTDLTGGEKINDFGFDHPVKYVKAVFETLLKAQNIEFDNNRKEQMHTVVIDDFGTPATDFGLDDATKQKLIANGKSATESFLAKPEHPPLPAD